jgi:hypothetical protein
MSPASISFGTGGGDTQVAGYLFINNVGTVRETFTLASVASSGGPAPALTANSVTLDPGASAALTVTFAASGLPAGRYEGFIGVTGAASGVESRVPYWYGVRSNTPGYITVLDTASSLHAGRLVTNAMTFHIADGAGIVMSDVTPVATTVSGGGTVMDVIPQNGYGPGVFSVNVRLGQTAGPNVFRITAGGISADIVLVSQ